MDKCNEVALDFSWTFIPACNYLPLKSHIKVLLSALRPKKLKDDDVAICVYKYDNPESACGEGCLNVMTSTECIHGHWPCQDYCKNQVSFTI